MLVTCLAQAVEAEVANFLGQHAELRTVVNALCATAH
jgi:hypothetical protein